MSASKKNSKLKTPELQELRREDWDFETFEAKLIDMQQSEQDSRLYQLFAYEYARSIPSIVEVFRNDQRDLRRMHNGTWRCSLILPPVNVPIPESGDLPSYSRFNQNDWFEPEYFPGFDALRVAAPKGFPDEPYLLIKDIINCERPFNLLNICDLPVSKVYEHDGFYLNENDHAVNEVNIARLHIDWHASDDAIVSSFRKWVAKARRHPPLNKKGKSIRRELWNNLKALGAWRLLELFKRDISEASRFCLFQAKKNLYERHEDWLIAQARAQEILDDLSRRIIVG